MDGKIIKYASRFALLVLLPFILGACLFPHTQYISGQALGAPNEVQNGISHSVTYAFVHNNENSFMANRINSVFPLAGYLDFPPFVNHGATAVCFADNGSYLILPNNSTIVPNFNWAVAFNNQTSLHVPPSSVSCAPIALGSQYSYEWKLNLIDVDTNVSGVATFVPRTATYTRMTMDFGILQGLVMIPVFYLLVVYPFVGLKRKILEGIEAQ